MNPNGINNNNINNNYINDNYYNLYRTEVNSPHQNKKQNISKNINDYRKNKINDNIYDTNINEINIYNNDTNKLNYYGNIPKFDINEINKINNNQNKGKGKEINYNFLNNKNLSRTIKHNDLNYVYMYNNLTERHLKKKKEEKGKIENKNDVKLNKMVGLPYNNKVIKYVRQQNTFDNVFNENKYTIRINKGTNMKFEPKKSNKIYDKNKIKV